MSDETLAGARILLVEDEAHLAINLRFNLEAEGYVVVVVGTLEAARAEVGNGPFDLILLDLMLPDGSGVDFCQALRQGGDRTPVLMLTARGASEHIVEGLGAGADDYVPKPFSLSELLGRIGALLRRRQWDSAPRESQSAAEEVLQLGPHRVEFALHRAVLGSGEEVELTELELALLRYFSRNENRVIPRGTLLEEVWGISARTNTRTVDNFLVRLRRLFEEDPARPALFVTVRGVGYRFVPPAAA